jgi:hypothetical protein
MKKSTSIFLLVLLLISSAAQAQFKKPLQSASSKVNSMEARYNIGLIGGVTSTYWFHFGGTKTKYQEPFNFGIVGGLSVERMMNPNLSLGIQGLYAMRNLQINYEVLNFPIALNESKDFYRQLDINYQEVNIQVPLTYYLSKSSIRPYVFVAPHVSIPLSGKMIWQKKEILNYGTADQHYSETGATVDTVEMNAQNTRQWNIGLVAGVGVMFKLNMNNYYFLIKADISAHADVINSFTKEEIHGESQNVVGAGYIDPYLLGTRFNTDATAKITFMFPLKKQLQGACIRWGEYD